MQLLLLVSIAILASFCQAQQDGCCLENFGQTCDGNALPKKYCPGGSFSCCPSASGFQCCGPLTQCDFVQKKCVLSSAFQYGSNPTPATVKFGFFSESLPFLIAQRNGYFQQENLIVRGNRTVSSQALFANLANGTFDIVSTAIDNTLNYIRNKKTPFSLLGRTLDIMAWYGTDRSLNQSIILNSRGPYPTLASLSTSKTRTDKLRVGVDAPETGFAFLVYDILKTFGLNREDKTNNVPGDYVIVQVGGGAQRLAALRNGSIDAAILGGENVLQAKAFGLNLAIKVVDIVGDVEGGTLMANRTFLDPLLGVPGIPNGVALRFTRALYKGTKYVVDPANKQDIIDFIRASATSIDPEAFYSVNLDDRTGITKSGFLVQNAVSKIIETRNANGGFENPTDPRTRCRLSIPRGGLFPKIGYNPDALYQTDTLKYVINSVGGSDRAPPVDYTCGGTIFGIVEDDEGNSAQGNHWSVLAMVFMAVVALIAY